MWREELRRVREDKGVESSYNVPVTTDPFYIFLLCASSSSSELATRNLFAPAIKSALGQVTSKPSSFSWHTLVQDSITNLYIADLRLISIRFNRDVEREKF